MHSIPNCQLGRITTCKRPCNILVGLRPFREPLSPWTVENDGSQSNVTNIRRESIINGPVRIPHLVGVQAIKLQRLSCFSLQTLTKDTHPRG